MSAPAAVFSQRRFKFYNAGDRLQQPILYSNPDGHDSHVICRYNLDAPAQGLFSVPEVVQVGIAQVHVHFAEDILKQYGDRGVVMIDANYEPPLRSEEYYDEKSGETRQRTTKEIDEEADNSIPMARNESEARDKGQRKWMSFVQLKIREHLEQCEQIRSAGGVPIAASGFIKRALKIAGIIDPAEAMMIEGQKQTKALESLNETLTRQSEENAQLREQVKVLLARDAEREKAAKAK